MSVKRNWGKREKNLNMNELKRYAREFVVCSIATKAIDMLITPGSECSLNFYRIMEVSGCNLFPSFSLR